MLVSLLLSFVGGVALVLLGSRLFLLAAEHLSLRLKLSPLIIGTLVLSLGATLPELFVTIAALANHDPGLAIGNSVGSVIVNIGLLFGVACMVSKVRVGTHKTLIEAVLLLLCAAGFVAVSGPDVPLRLQTAISFSLLVGSFGSLIVLSLIGRQHEDVQVMHQLVKRLQFKKIWNMPRIVGAVAVSVAGLLAGSVLVVQSVEVMSVSFGISTTILGLTLTALATSTPELVLTFVSGRKKEEKALIGTLVGSSIINLTLFPGLIALSGYSSHLPVVQLLSLVVTVGVFVAIIFKFTGKVVPVKAGAVLLLTWILFMVFTYF